MVRRTVSPMIFGDANLRLSDQLAHGCCCRCCLRSFLFKAMSVKVGALLIGFHIGFHRLVWDQETKVVTESEDAI
jgi:hypothetical protein